MAIYAVGDIQGCLDPLKKLLDKVCFDPAKDQLWCAGDLVNRGPQSLETLRFLYQHASVVRCVLGNHDLHLLAGYAERHLPHRHTRQPVDEDLLSILDAEDAEVLLDWLRQQPLLHQDASLPGIAMLHAGVLPEWTLADATRYSHEFSQMLRSSDWFVYLPKLWGNQPSRWANHLTGIDRWRVIVNALTRMRFCSPDGELLLAPKGSPEQAPAGAVPWFLAPTRKTVDQLLITGHWSAAGLRFQNGVLMLDSGCVWGGCLSMVRLDEIHKQPNNREAWRQSIVQVHCEEQATPLEQVEG